MTVDRALVEQLQVAARQAFHKAGDRVGREVGGELLDEPGNGLDTAALDRLGTAMAAHRARGGIVMAATHQPLALPGAVEIPLGAAR